MDVHARLRNLRMAPRKVRLVIDMIRGKSVDQALTQLRFLRRDAARPVLKLLQSAMANAEHNFKLDSSTLRVKTITADGGMTLKRYRPRAHGAAAPIRKRTTHINLVLTDEPAPVSEKKRPARRAPAKSKKTIKKAAPAPEAPKATSEAAPTEAPAPTNDTPSTNE